MWVVYFALFSIFAFAMSQSALADPRDVPGIDTQIEFRRPARIPFPAYNPYRHEVAILGKMLFFDPRLSGSQNISCSTCHNPSFGWATPVHPLLRANGTDGQRHAPTIVNAAWIAPLFWDGRAETLEEQAVGPIENPFEMASDFDTIVSRLRKIDSYRQWFERNFPEQGVSKDTIVAALATYQRTIVSGVAPFDRWISGNPDAISPAAKRGFDLFTGRAGCIQCHTGWMFTDNGMHDVGLIGSDEGQGALPDQPPEARFRFKTPGLRNISLRAPFMHDGSIPSLRDVIRHYANGGSIWLSRDHEIQPFEINDTEIGEIIAFLNTLTAVDAVVQPPILPSN